MIWYHNLQFQLLNIPKVNNDDTRITSVDVIWVSRDQCDTQHVTITCNYNLLEKILHSQSSILLLAFLTDLSVASIVCLVV